jgi:hypothetical protein
LRGEEKEMRGRGEREEKDGRGGKVGLPVVGFQVQRVEEARVGAWYSVAHGIPAESVGY